MKIHGRFMAMPDVCAAFGWLAAEFVSEPDNWPRFQAWIAARRPDGTGLVAERPEQLRLLVEGLHRMSQ